MMGELCYLEEHREDGHPMSSILSLKMAFSDAITAAVGDPVALGQLLAVCLSHEAILRGLLDESAAPSPPLTGVPHGAQISQKR